MTRLEDSWRLSAASLTARFASRALDPRTALEAVLARHDAVRPALNASVLVDRAAARRSRRSMAWR